MVEMLGVSGTIAAPLGLLGLAAALGYLIYCRRLKHQETVVAALPDSQRAQAVDEYLTRYNLDASNLTREQKYNLLMAEMGKRYALAQAVTLGSCGVFTLCFIVAVYAYVSQPPTGRGMPQDEDPSVDLSEPIRDQVQLFAQDKVRIVGFTDGLDEVWFGKVWEKFDPSKNDGRVYTVWGPVDTPIVPQFKGTGHIKLNVSYTRNRDKPRDLDRPPGGLMERK